MTKVAQAVMAVVHVQAPAQVDPHAIEAELVRALNTYRKRPMSAEFTLAPDHRSRSLGGRRRHGFVGILSFAACAPPADLQRRVQKAQTPGPSSGTRHATTARLHCRCGRPTAPGIVSPGPGTGSSTPC